MLLFQVLLLVWIFCHRTYSTEALVFTMVQHSYFPNSSFMETVGNATLDGKLTHYLESQNKQLNLTQFLSLESSQLWKMRESDFSKYLENFENVVNMFARERRVLYPLDVHCIQGCWISENGSNGTFYKVLVNGDDFLRFHADNHTWIPLQDTPVASYASEKLNAFQESSTVLQVFLQETCINFVREQTEIKEASIGKREGRPHTSLVLGISLGALAVMGLAVCIFLCTGGKR